VTDLNQPMLDYAAARQNRDERLHWRTANAQALAVRDAAFDLVCCQFGVMFSRIARPPTARRGACSSRADFPVQAWDRIEENVFADDVTNALAEFFPGRSSALYGPHTARLSRHPR